MPAAPPSTRALSRPLLRQGARDLRSRSRRPGGACRSTARCCSAIPGRVAGREPARLGRRAEARGVDSRRTAAALAERLQHRGSLVGRKLDYVSLAASRNDRSRSILMAHEMWHRVQDSIGFPPTNPGQPAAGYRRRSTVDAARVACLVGASPRRAMRGAGARVTLPSGAPAATVSGADATERGSR